MNPITNSNDSQTSPAKTTKRARSIGQFSIRFLLLVMIISGCGLGWLSSHQYRAAREREIEELLLEHDAYIVFDYQIGDDGEMIKQAIPPGPDWLKKLFDNRFFAKMVEVEIMNAQKLVDFEWMDDLPHLEYLCVGGSPVLENLDALQGTRNLKAVQFNDCPKLTNVDGLELNLIMEEVILNSNPELVSLDGLKRMSNLTSLNLYGSESLVDVEPLRNLKKLQRLNLFRCGSIKSLEPLSGLTDLRRLSVLRIPGGSDLNLFRSCSKLDSLHITDCSELTDVSGLSLLKKLKLLSLSKGSLIKDSAEFEKALEGLDRLEILSLANFNGLKQISFPKLPALRNLDLVGFDSITQVSGFENLPSLIKLRILKCNSLTDLNNIAQSSKLGFLTISECENLSNFSGLKKVESLGSIVLGVSFTREQANRLQQELPDVQVRGGR